MIKKIILFGTASLFCVMFIAYSCNNNQNPVKKIIDTGTTLITTTTDSLVTDPSLPPPTLDATLLEWDGTTTEEPTLASDIYEIENANELAWIAEQTNDFTGKTIKLIENINMNDQAFNGIASFAGTLDGNNKIIHKLNISKTSVDNVGLIGSLETNGVIKDLIISEGSISGNDYVGGIVGINNGDNTIISNVANYNVSVTGVRSIGGIVGFNANNLTVENAVNSGDITGTYYIGGIIGRSYRAGTPTVNITKVRNAGNISGSIYIGGIVGSSSSTMIKDAGNSGIISGYAGVGGLVGVVFNNPAVIDDSYNYTEVIASWATGEAGGIVGIVYEVASTLDINGSYYLTTTYGSFGKNQHNATVTDNSTEINLAEFATQSTFTGWDFSNTWDMGTLHPILK